MGLTPRVIAAFAATAILLSFGSLSASAASVLYGATNTDGAGSLYTLDPATGAVISTIGALVDSGGNRYTLTGLAFQPGTGVLYGSTTSISTTAPRHLVIVDTANGLVTDLGSEGNLAIADLSFSADGTLYGQP